LQIAKILDFGLVKPIAPTHETATLGETGPGELVGTVRHMSPEQLRGENPAGRLDIWALVVVAYEILTGNHPFAASTASDPRHAILAGNGSPLCAHLPDAPPHWQRFFDHALSARVELRPRSELQLLSDFKRSIGNIVLRASPKDRQDQKEF
jgi:serine/threonine protein kinase